MSGKCSRSHNIEGRLASPSTIFSEHTEVHYTLYNPLYIIQVRNTLYNPFLAADCLAYREITFSEQAHLSLFCHALDP